MVAEGAIDLAKAHLTYVYSINYCKQLYLVENLSTIGHLQT